MKDEERIYQMLESKEKYHQEQVIKQMELAVRRMEEKTEDLKKRVEDIKRGDNVDPGSLPITAIDKVTWFVNDMENLMRNFDFNQIMASTIRWAQTKAELKALQEKE